MPICRPGSPPLTIAAELVPALAAGLTAENWQERQHAPGRALGVLQRAQHEAGLPTPPVGVIEPFFDRPFLGVRAETVDRLLATVDDRLVRRLPPGVGAVEQWTDNVKILTDRSRRVRAARAHLEGASGRGPV